MSQQFKKGIINKYNTFSYSSSTTHELTMDQSGSVIFIDSSSNNVTFKLPAVADNAGGNFKFVATAAGNNLVFNQNESSGTNVIKLNTAAANTQSVVTMVLGECVECITDGTYWYVIELN